MQSLLYPKNAVLKAKSPLTKEIAKANSPRFRHPKTSIGDKPTAKKINSRMTGIII